MKRLTAPFNTPTAQKDLLDLRAGELVLLSGTILTGRDAAHKRLSALQQAGQPLPFELSGECIYYVGPCPAAEGEVIGPCGPTTSARVDGYTPALIEAGLLGMIGKGFRSQSVIDAMVQKGAVYFCATGGAAVLLKGHVTAAEVLAFPELGAEAVFRLTVLDMPLVVGIDAMGNDLYKIGPAQYCKR